MCLLHLKLQRKPKESPMIQLFCHKQYFNFFIFFSLGKNKISRVCSKLGFNVKWESLVSLKSSLLCDSNGDSILFRDLSHRWMNVI